jgi:hypothetical protein
MTPESERLPAGNEHVSEFVRDDEAEAQNR